MLGFESKKKNNQTAPLNLPVAASSSWVQAEPRHILTKILPNLTAGAHGHILRYTQ